MNTEEKITTWLVVIAIAIGITAVFLQPYFEMRAFNRFSETKATYFDAVFSELRVTPQGGRGDI